jgi:hypothetical protein
LDHHRKKVRQSLSFVERSIRREELNVVPEFGKQRARRRRRRRKDPASVSVKIAGDSRPAVLPSNTQFPAR